MSTRRFRVYVGTWASTAIEVELTDEEVAREFDDLDLDEIDLYDMKNLALDKALDSNENYVSLCHHCACKVDLNGSLDMFPNDTVDSAVEEI